MNFITQKRKEILTVFPILSLIALFLGMFSIFLFAKPNLSGFLVSYRWITKSSFSMFDPGWNDIPIAAVKNHHNFVLAGGFIGIFASITAIGISSFSISKMIYNDKLTIAVVVLSLIALIFSSIALAFNRDLNSYEWWFWVRLEWSKKI